ncbi:Erf-like ssDNA annealing protein [Mycobacterium phage Kumao]|uniref:ERF family ssDNA binding protein n=1 Tax=Mycobacterium phage Kumao TaxID=2041344 RepID=A0A2D1GPS8_9CAUD|nr:Erf-like ssDNA annealing protein [Mycobacterium phage Kumao]ATN94010.1 ERF family ssDNA binding protein [Mycobacterium phage Kumao]
MTTTQLDQLLPALHKAREGFGTIQKDGFNPHFKSEFATLKSIKAAVDPALHANGLQILQFPSEVNGSPALTTILAHTASGQHIEYTTPLALTKNDPQAQGSALTYLRRYSYSAVLNLVTDEDDDGNVGSLPDKPKQQKPQQRPQQPPQQQAPQPDPRVVALGNVINEAKRIGIDKDGTERLFVQVYGENLMETRSVKALQEFAQMLPELVAQCELNATVVQ